MTNSSFLNCLLPLFQNVSWCTTFHMEMSLICKTMNVQVKLIYTIMKGCAPGLILKQRQKATQKWPIPLLDVRSIIILSQICCLCVNI